MALQRTDDEWIDLIYTILTAVKFPNEVEIDPDLAEKPNFKKLWRFLEDLRELSYALSRGDLQKFAYSKGFILSNLKALQANLRHLTWQTKQVADGDFSQRVEFLGEFSDSFNEMAAKLEKSTETLMQLANLDFLTQLPNRRTAIRSLEQIHALFKRHGRPYCVTMFDIDHFKSVNDTHGHDAGDRVLQSMGATMRGLFRETDVFARFGGEEFIAVLPETDIRGAITLAEKVRGALASTAIELPNGTILYKTVSIGIAEASPSDSDFSKIIVRSDRALYEAKESGRNKICVSESPELVRIVKNSANTPQENLSAAAAARGNEVIESNV
ncbi:MAG: GGDEF domain-containing protein [Clostridiales Family XIII bacterium]|jgi:diguanylate cyclase (GGDEF)-like protein|nr:GGDEF domain-containing protein [Clostridiales Family XIII bacterium]